MLDLVSADLGAVVELTIDVEREPAIAALLVQVETAKDCEVATVKCPPSSGTASNDPAWWNVDLTAVRAISWSDCCFAQAHSSIASVLKGCSRRAAFSAGSHRHNVALTVREPRRAH